MQIKNALYTKNKLNFIEYNFLPGKCLKIRGNEIRVFNMLKIIINFDERLKLWKRLIKFRLYF